MASVAGVTLTTPRVVAKAPDTPKTQTLKAPWLNHPWRKSSQFRRVQLHLQPVAAAPERISEKVAESIKNAEETCAGDATSGECVAAWDEVEELSAAASHARDKKKDYDPLEDYCKDNPETDECRTFED